MVIWIVNAFNGEPTMQRGAGNRYFHQI